ncbi:uncharacterized protein B0I36DRAFT_358493 [Microdochium trichocladiopsis]|uniref:Uncharacterized protein n=1 Tax=Microdochium trichocladiopsis TaxID=1682393 RepID=A0A9P9BX77_9PEZI|nr:uncharacterized protein B0I36DRAFT_358493 [Microdochium trichocladiopsis]KAH7041310.1 hypothetical protein B0I36DRAFT_358493 [Microdochium trichocladiopsis]
MTPAEKTQASGSEFEVSSQEQSGQYVDKRSKTFDAIQVALSSLSLLCGLVVLGTSSSVASVYSSTHLPIELDLPLWPEDFDIRPTNALIAGGVLVAVVNFVALAFAKIQKLQKLQMAQRIVTFAAPSIGFLSVFVAVVLFYSVNASTTTDTVHSWSCQWDYTPMSTKPYFDSVCKESKTALYLSIILIPVEAAALGLGLYRMLLERKALQSNPASKSSSPSLA